MNITYCNYLLQERIDKALHPCAGNTLPAMLLALARRTARLTRSGCGARSGGGTRVAPANT